MKKDDSSFRSFLKFLKECLAPSNKGMIALKEYLVSYKKDVTAFKPTLSPLTWIGSLFFLSIITIAYLVCILPEIARPVGRDIVS